MGGESAIFEFQGNKLLEGTTNLDARHSDFNHASGDQWQSLVDSRVVVNWNVIIVIEDPSRSRERGLENVVKYTTERMSLRTSPSMTW